MTNTYKVLLTFLGAGSLAACGLGGDSEKPLTEAQYCEQRAEAECEILARDCTLTASAVGACQASRSQACQQEVASVSPASGRAFKPANAKLCIEETKKAFSALMSAAVWTSLRQVCARAFEGMVAINEACAGDLDCTNGLVCDKGVCGTLKVVAAGAPCSNPGEVCGMGQFCVLQPTSFWACSARLAQGAACDANNRCLESLRCSEGTCQPALGASEACAADADCAAPLICDPVQSKCATSVNLTFRCVDYAQGGVPGDAGTNG